MIVKKISPIVLLVLLSVETSAFSPPKPGVRPSAKVREYQPITAVSYGQGGVLQRIAAWRQERTRTGLREDVYMSFPVLLGRYQDGDTLPSVPQNLQRELFDGPWPTITMAEDYADMSYGQFHLSGQVYGWFNLLRSGAYYEGSQTEPYDNGFVGPPGGAGSFLHDVLVIADQSVDFAQYDNDGPDGIPNSGDDDGFVDAVFFVHSGPGGEGGGPYIWSHRWRYAGWWGSPFVTNDSSASGGFIKINDYIIQPAESSVGGGLIEIGVFAHEFGHVLGLPDLYDTDYSSDGIGNWGLMGGGSWNTPAEPAHLCAWSREMLGWLTPYMPAENIDSLAIPAIETHPYAVKLWTQGQVDDWVGFYSHGANVGQEYFLIENRQRLLADNHLIGTGILIWHIDNTVNTNSNDEHRMVQLVAADNESGVDTDAGDPWPGLTNNRNFDFETLPAAIDWNGQNTQVAVLNISDSDTLMWADIEVHETRPHLSVVDVSVEDASGDQVLEPGESGELWVEIRNTGGAASGVRGFLSTASAEVQIIQDSVGFPDLDFLQERISDNPFEIHISSTALPALVPLEIRLIAQETTDTVLFNYTLMIGAPRVGLVDDDGSTATTPNRDFRSWFVQALTIDTLVYALWDNASAGLPPLDWMLSKPVVIWFTGDATTPLNSDEVALLRSFVEGGGRLLLTGENLGESYEIDSLFFREELGWQRPISARGQVYVFGDPEHELMNIEDRYVINSMNAAHHTTSPDALPSAGGEVLLYYPYFDDLPAAITLETLTHRAMTLGFGLEALASVSPLPVDSVQADFLKRAWEWLQSPLTGIEQSSIPLRPKTVAIARAYPNPFNPQLTIELSAVPPAGSWVELYDLTGRLVAKLTAPMGKVLAWQPQGLASGVYFLRLRLPGQVASRP